MLPKYIATEEKKNNNNNFIIIRFIDNKKILYNMPNS